MKKTKNKVLIITTAIVLSFGGIGTIFASAPVITDGEIVEVCVEFSKEDPSIEILNNYFVDNEKIVKSKVESHIEEIKAKQEEERIKKEEQEKFNQTYGQANSSKKINIIGVGYPSLDENLFGSYAEQARQVYDYIISGNTSDLEIKGFATNSDVKNFAQTFRANYGLFASSYLSYQDGTSGIRYKTEYLEKIINYRKSLNYVNSIINSIVNENMTETEAVSTISQWILNHSTYQLNQHSAWTLLTSNVGNCNAYATTFELMARACNIQCDFVRGDAGGAHGWNRVVLNGQYYYVDLTFADTSGNNNYLLSRNLWTDHTFIRIDNTFMFN